MLGTGRWLFRGALFFLETVISDHESHDRLRVASEHGCSPSVYGELKLPGSTWLYLGCVAVPGRPDALGGSMTRET